MCPYPRAARPLVSGVTVSLTMLSVFALVFMAGVDLDTELRVLQAAAKENEAFAIVESLTTEVGSRLAGSEAEARARAWAVKKLTALGFKNIRVESTSVPGWERGEEVARIVRPFPQNLAITALGGSVATPAGGLSAELLPFETLTDLQAAPAGALHGKIAFINQAMPKTQDGSGYGAVVAIRSQGPSVAAAKGAAAILIRSVGTDHHRFPHTGMLQYADESPKIPAAALSAPDADQLSRIFARKEKVFLHLELKPRMTGDKPTGNVIAEIPGRIHPEEIILLGAHLDSWDLGTGAVDDGAGVAIVTAAAKLILDHSPRPPARTIRVVLFGAEEVGLVGAKAYAKRHADELPRHIVALESDFGAGPVYRLSGHVPDRTWPILESLQKKYLARLMIVPGENHKAGGPDLYPLRPAKVPIIGLEQDGRDYFDLHHTADDTVDKINPHSLSQNVAAYATVAWWASEIGPRFRLKPEAAEKSSPTAGE